MEWVLESGMVLGSFLWLYTNERPTPDGQVKLSASQVLELREVLDEWLSTEIR